jgi:hypothetical protein
MKKVLLTVVMGTALSLSLATIASASITVGYCTLHAYVPTYFAGSTTGEEEVQAHGQVNSCSYGPSSIELQVCTQVNSGSGWATMSYSCVTHTWTNTGDTGQYNDYAEPIGSPGCGRWYRTWDWTYIKWPNGASASSSYVGNANYWC